MKKGKGEKQMKKKISVALATVISLSCIGMMGCTSQNPNEPYVPKDLFPTYANDKEITIGGWNEPISTLEDYQMAKDMGLNMMFVGAVPRGSDEFFDVMEYCEEVGMDVILTIGNATTHGGDTDPWEVDDTDYTKYPAIKAINYWDEPHAESFDQIAGWARTHTQKYGDKIDFLCNHYPNSVWIYDVNNNPGKYSDVMEQYVNKIFPETLGTDWLSYDLYPLSYNGMYERWLQNIEDVAVLAKKHGAATNVCIQGTEHWSYREVFEEDLRFQFFVNMAFGIQNFTYFTYADSILEDFSTSFVSITKSCAPRPRYYYAQKVNHEILAFDHVYLSFEWQKTMPVIGSNNTSGSNVNFNNMRFKATSLDCLQSVTSTEDALVGHFKDKDNNDGLIVTNFTNPNLSKKNKVTLNFKNADRARVYYRGEYKDYLVVNNQMEISLDAGDGVFIIPMAGELAE